MLDVALGSHGNNSGRSPFSLTSKIVSTGLAAMWALTAFFFFATPRDDEAIQTTHHIQKQPQEFARLLAQIRTNREFYKNL